MKTLSVFFLSCVQASIMVLAAANVCLMSMNPNEIWKVALALLTSAGIQIMKHRVYQIGKEPAEDGVPLVGGEEGVFVEYIATPDEHREIDATLKAAGIYPTAVRDEKGHWYTRWRLSTKNLYRRFLVNKRRPGERIRRD